MLAACDGASRGRARRSRITARSSCSASHSGLRHRPLLVPECSMPQHAPASCLSHRCLLLRCSSCSSSQQAACSSALPAPPSQPSAQPSPGPPSAALDAAGAEAREKSPWHRRARKFGPCGIRKRSCKSSSAPRPSQPCSLFTCLPSRAPRAPSPVAPPTSSALACRDACRRAASSSCQPIHTTMSLL